MNVNDQSQTRLTEITQMLAHHPDNIPTVDGMGLFARDVEVILSHNPQMIVEYIKVGIYNSIMRHDKQYTHAMVSDLLEKHEIRRHVPAVQTLLNFLIEQVETKRYLKDLRWLLKHSMEHYDMPEAVMLLDKLIEQYDIANIKSFYEREESWNVFDVLVEMTQEWSARINQQDPKVDEDRIKRHALEVLKKLSAAHICSDDEAGLDTILRRIITHAQPYQNLNMAIGLLIEAGADWQHILDTTENLKLRSSMESIFIQYPAVRKTRLEKIVQPAITANSKPKI